MVDVVKNIAFAVLVVAIASFFYTPSDLMAALNLEIREPEPVKVVVATPLKPVITQPITANAPVETIVEPEQTTVLPTLVATVQTSVEAEIQTAQPASVEVTASSVNLRAGPTTNDEILGRVSKGTMLVHLEETQGDWIKVGLDRIDQPAWIHGDLVKVIKNPFLSAAN